MKKVVSIICFMALTACSQGSMSNKWDCPAQDGHRCIPISDADDVALTMLKGEDYRAKKEQVIVTKGIKRTVWFNKYTDSELTTFEPSLGHYEE